MKTFLVFDNKKQRTIPLEFRGDDNRNPEVIVKYFLNQYTKKGDKVIDMFAGLGTTMIVAEQMKRIPFGIEFNKQRADYIKSQVSHKGNIIHGSSLKLKSYSLPQCDFSFTSPPYMAKDDKENPFTSYTTKGGGYRRYLQDIKKIYTQLKQFMKKNAYLVIEVSNLKGKELTLLAWDIAKEVSKVFSLEGEVVVGWKGKESYGKGGSYGYGYDHSYCLIFKNI